MSRHERRPRIRARLRRPERLMFLVFVGTGLLLALRASTAAYHSLGILMLSAALAVYLWVPLAGVMVGWPISAEAAVRRLPVRRLFPALLLMVALGLGPLVAPETALLIRSDVLPLPLRALALLLAVVCALPAWTFLLGWRRIFAARRTAGVSGKGHRLISSWFST